MVKDVAQICIQTTTQVTASEAKTTLIMTNKRMTTRKAIIILTTKIVKKINLTVIIVIDLEETTDKAMIDRVMEMTEVIMIEGGKAIRIETVVGEIGMIMAAKLKIMAMTEVIKTIEGTDLGEMIIEVEEVAVTERGMAMMIIMVTTILKIGDVEEMMVSLEKAMIKMNQRKERYTFHRNNLMMKISYLETTYQWE